MPAAAFKAWLPLAVLLTVALGTVYVVGQQILRQSANDPQIQLAEDWADQITTGASVTSLAMGSFVDPNHSLAPFGIVYDQSGNVTSSSVTAPTTMLQPSGVLGAVDQALNQEARFTWQPASGARFATVIKRANFGDKSYYVLAARNLREVESREEKIMLLVFGAWVVGLVLLLMSQHTHIAGRTIRRIRTKQAK